MALLFLLAFVYLPFFLRSFLCPRHPHVLNVYFGVPGSGKTTFAAHLTKWALHENILIRFCRNHENRVTRLLLNSRYLKRRIKIEKPKLREQYCGVRLVEAQNRG